MVSKPASHTIGTTKNIYYNFSLEIFSPFLYLSCIIVKWLNWVLITYLPKIIRYMTIKYYCNYSYDTFSESTFFRQRTIHFPYYTSHNSKAIEKMSNYPQYFLIFFINKVISKYVSGGSVDQRLMSNSLCYSFFLLTYSNQMQDDTDTIIADRPWIANFS